MSRWNLADTVSILLSGLILAGVVLAPTLSEVGLLPEQTVCLSQRIAGIECPGCGMTRSVVALGRGDLEASLRLNWAAPSMLILALLHVTARGARLFFPGLELRTFDLVSLGAIVVILLARVVTIW